MDCVEKGCPGNVNEEHPVFLPVDRTRKRIAYACWICGRLYWPNGKPVYTRYNEKGYWWQGQIIRGEKNKKKLETPEIDDIPAK